MRDDNIERFTHLRDVIGWTCDAEGNVFGAKGQRIGYYDRYGYLRSTQLWKGRLIKVALHQYVYFFFTGQCPKLLDHINKVRDDNRPNNLREVSTEENCWNRKTVKGYRYRQTDGMYHAKITFQGKDIELGRFKTEFEASRAYLEAKHRLHQYANKPLNLQN